MRKTMGMVIGPVVALGVLFGAAGNLAWWNAWVFLAFMIPVGVLTQRLVNQSPGLSEERKTAAAKAEPWDVPLVRLIHMALPLMLILAALDQRFQWLPSVPDFISILAFVAMVPANILTYRAMAANLFFSSHVRIQRDRGHVVITQGPYSVIRHPGYAGSIVFNLLVPLALGSWIAWLPGLGTAILLVYRTFREDRVLMKNLPGYPRYAEQVRFRLCPGIV